jgi:hypothetical protein
MDENTRREDRSAEHDAGDRRQAADRLRIDRDDFVRRRAETDVPRRTVPSGALTQREREERWPIG